MIAFQLLRPFGYLAIHHPRKKIIDWYIPLLLAFLSLGVLFFLRGRANVWGDGGLVENLQGLIQGLPGFYIAALAAVATFGAKFGLDALIPKPTPTISTIYGSGKIEIGLTRRRFLCLLFAHLTALSISLSIGSAFLRYLSKAFYDSSPLILTTGFVFGSFAYFVFLFQLVVVSFWGLYYLSDRIHQPDALPAGGNEGDDNLDEAE